MRTRTMRLTVLLFHAVVACAVFAGVVNAGMATQHPVEVEVPVMCSQCHSDSRASMDHSAEFGVRHKYYARQNSAICGVCHQQAFCADCHAHKEELKPSDKYKDAPARILPHRGDYLTQHKIDGRLNPASCFPCHGRQNNERCRACHR